MTIESNVRVLFFIELARHLRTLLSDGTVQLWPTPQHVGRVKAKGVGKRTDN